MINKSFLLGEGSYANGQTVLEVMNQKYSIYRERIENYIIKSLFLPMAIRNDWVEYEQGTIKKEKKLRYLYPKVRWNRLNFVDDTAHKQMLSQMVLSGQIDLQTWLECFGLDHETIQDRLKRFEGTPLDINYFALMNGAATEAGRLLAPAISELRAKQLGIKMPDETGEETFASKNEKIQKQSSEETIEKKAETREERRYRRQINKSDKARNDAIKELEIPLDKRLKPERTDQKKVKLFAEDQHISIPDIAIIDTDKAEELGKQVLAEESSKNVWVEIMSKDLDLNQNARRAALNLENELLSLNENANSNEKKQIFLKYIPQLFASKIEEELPILDKVTKAKEVFSERISNLTNYLEEKLNSNLSAKLIKSTIRQTLKQTFSK